LNSNSYLLRKHGPKPKKLFVGNVSQKTTEEDLQAYFSKFGVITENQIMRNGNHGNHRGFGFIRFESQEVTDSVQREKHTVDGNLLTINLAKAKTLKFFVGGIARDRTTDVTMRKYFEQFGEIDDIFCIVDRGFGFVTLIDEGDNLKPIIQESHHEIDGKLCEVRVARPKEEYQRSLAQRGSGRGGRGRGRRGGRGGGYGGYGRGGGDHHGGSRGGWGGYNQNPYYGQGHYGGGYNQWQPQYQGSYGARGGSGGSYNYQPY
jgi:RNA recognition motif-containing protein